jgi:hypothetical protein
LIRLGLVRQNALRRAEDVLPAQHVVQAACCNEKKATFFTVFLNSRRKCVWNLIFFISDT